MSALTELRIRTSIPEPVPALENLGDIELQGLGTPSADEIQPPSPLALKSVTIETPSVADTTAAKPSLLSRCWTTFKKAAPYVVSTASVVTGSVLASFNAKSLADYRVSVLSSLFITGGVRSLFEAPMLQKFRNAFFKLPVDWMVENAIIFTVFNYFEQDFDTAEQMDKPEGANTVFITMLACAVFAYHLFPSSKKDNDGNDPMATQSLIRRDLEKAADPNKYPETQQLLSRSLWQTALIEFKKVNQIAKASLGVVFVGIGAGVPQVSFLLDLGIYTIFHAIGDVGESIFYSIWLQKEHEQLRSPTPTIPLQLKAMRGAVKVTSLAVAPVTGFLMPVKQPAVFLLIGLLSGFDRSVAKRQFKQILETRRDPTQETPGPTRLQLIGTIFSEIVVMSFLLASCGESLKLSKHYPKIQEGTIAFICGLMAVYPLSHYVFKKLERGETDSRIIRWVAFNLFHSEIFSNIVVYGINYTDLSGVSRYKASSSERAAINFILTNMGAAISAHRGVSCSFLAKGRLAQSRLASTVSGSMISYYWGRGTNPSYVDPSNGLTLFI